MALIEGPAVGFHLVLTESYESPCSCTQFATALQLQLFAISGQQTWAEVCCDQAAAVCSSFTMVPFLGVLQMTLLSAIRQDITEHLPNTQTLAGTLHYLAQNVKGLAFDSCMPYNIWAGAAHCKRLYKRQRWRLTLYLYSCLFVLHAGSAGKGNVHNRVGGTPGSASRRSGGGPAGVTIVEDDARPAVNVEMQRLLRAPRCTSVMQYSHEECLQSQMPS